MKGRGRSCGCGEEGSSSLAVPFRYCRLLPFSALSVPPLGCVQWPLTCHSPPPCFFPLSVQHPQRMLSGRTELTAPKQNLIIPAHPALPGAVPPPSSSWGSSSTPHFLLLPPLQGSLPLSRHAYPATRPPRAPPGPPPQPPTSSPSHPSTAACPCPATDTRRFSLSILKCSHLSWTERDNSLQETTACRD